MEKAFLKNCVKGLLVAVCASVILLFLFGWICYTKDDPAPLMGILGRAALYLSVFAGGFAASKFNKGMGLLSGVCTGTAFMLTVLTVSLFIRDGQPIGILGWVMFLLVAAVGTAGGFLGVPTGKKRKKHSRRRK